MHNLQSENNFGSNLLDPANATSERELLISCKLNDRMKYALRNSHYLYVYPAAEDAIDTDIGQLFSKPDDRWEMLDISKIEYNIAEEMHEKIASQISEAS